MDAAHSFRVCLQKSHTSKNAEKPSCGIIYVAKTWPPWQSLILTTLKELYTVRFCFIFKNAFEKFVEIFLNFLHFLLFRQIKIVCQKIKL